MGEDGRLGEVRGEEEGEIEVKVQVAFIFKQHSAFSPPLGRSVFQNVAVTLFPPPFQCLPSFKPSLTAERAV